MLTLSSSEELWPSAAPSYAKKLYVKQCSFMSSCSSAAGRQMAVLRGCFREKTLSTVKLVQSVLLCNHVESGVILDCELQTPYHAAYTFTVYDTALA